MSDMSTSLLLLLVALALLWLAVTDKLSRVLDAWEVIRTGNTTGATQTVSNPLTGGPVVFQLPSLPAIGTTGQVPI